MRGDEEEVRAFGSVSPMFWTRGSGKKIRGDKEAQLVALYLMTSPHTSMVGIFHLSLPTLCHETGLTTEEARKGLVRCSQEAIALWDEDEELVFLPALSLHQIGESLKKTDHKVKGVSRYLAPFKGHRFYDLFLERYAKSYSLSEAPSESLGRDDVPDPDPDPDLSDPGTTCQVGPAADARKVFDFWRKEHGHDKAKLDKKRLTRIKARFREGFTVQELCVAIRAAKQDRFLMGENDTGTVYDELISLLRDAPKVEKLLGIVGGRNKVSQSTQNNGLGEDWQWDIDKFFAKTRGESAP